jgi:hypothetical protein
MKHKSLITSIFIIISGQTLALPQINNQKHYEYNIFKLGGGLVDGSIMKYSKCVNDGKVTKLEDLIEDTVKLDCNNHTNIKRFCECIDAVSSATEDHEDKITEDLSQRYQRYLLDHPEIQKEFHKVRVEQLSNELNLYFDDPNKCSPTMHPNPIGSGYEQRISHSEVDIFRQNTPYYEAAVATVQRMYDNYKNTRYKDASIHEIEHNVNLMLEIEKNGELNSPIHKGVINDVISFINESHLNAHSTGAKITDYSIRQSLDYVLLEKCTATDQSFIDLQNDEFTEQMRTSTSFQEFTTEIMSAQNRMSYYYDFVESRTYHPDEEKMIQQKFEADIFFCKQVTDEDEGESADQYLEV